MHRGVRAAIASSYIALFALTVWSWIAEPSGATFAIHWGLNGAANRVAGREALLIAPVVAIVVGVLLNAAMRFDPHRKNLMRSGRVPGFAIGVLTVSVTLLLAAMQVAVAATGFGNDVRLDRAAPIGIGLLFVALGAVMPQVHQNYTFGIRLPWTLASEKAWDAAHRIVGTMWIALGVVVIGTGVLVGGGLSIALLLIGLAVSIAVASVVAYRTWAADPQAHGTRPRR